MKYLLISLLFLFSSLQFARAQQLEMDLEWICSTTNTADFQIRVTNTGTVPIAFNALIIRGVHAPNITNGTITFQALNDNTIPAWLGWPQMGTTNLPYISSQRKLSFSSGTSIFTNVTAPLIPSGSGIVVGTFRMLTTTTWVPNSDFGFVWEATSGGIVGYVNGEASVTGIQHYGVTGGVICGQCLTVTASIAQPLNLSAPTSPANQSFCSAATVSDLIASPLYSSPQNAIILWYNSQTGGTALNPTTLITSGTYYAVQIVNGCESARTAVAVSVIPVQITASDPLICQGETVSLSIPQSGSSNTICAALPANLQNGLVGYWPFCGNANDESGNGNNGTVNGATLTTDRFGNANSAYSFDGVDDWIDISTGFFNNGWNEMSINLWFNSSSNIATSGPGQTFLNTSPHNGIVIGYSYSGNQKIYVFKNSNPASSSWDTFANAQFNASSIPLNTWHNISIVKSGLTYQFYFDGQLDNTLNTSTVALNYFCNLRFGAITCCNPEVFNGKLDDISIFSRSLSLSEIQQIYNLEQITYLWSNGATTPTINVSPNNTTTYACTATSNGESCTNNYSITVNNSSDSTVLVTACDSYTWLDGNTYTTANNTATFTTTNAASCDSIITLNLTITPSTINTTPISACGTYTWANNGQTYTTSGTYTGATVNCVTEILDLTITPSTTNTTPISACGTYTWLNNSQTYTTSGIYSGTTANCVTESINLTITPSTSNTTPISSCGPYTWSNNGQTYTVSGIYSGTTANCVTEIIDLTITTTTINTTLISACGSYTWVNNGQAYTASGIYTGATINCVTETLDLTITPNTTNTTPISACGTYSWANNGQTYTASGIYSGTTANCVTESINLTITPSTSNTTPISACGTYTWLNNSQTYTVSGIYSGTTANCVTETLDLTITTSTTNTTPISACGTYSWANNGQTYTSSGIYSGTTANCVTESINLTISPSTTNTTPISACGSYTWANNGQTYTTSGAYIGATANCISETLNLTITPSSINTTPISACGSYTWANNGQTYTTSGVFNGTTTNCITQVLNLNITPISSFTTTISECDTYTWANNGQTYTTSGIFNGTTINCVLQVLNLVIIDCQTDSDNDGLTDYEESFLCTTPSLFDTDGDGISDGDENAQGSDPCDPCSPDINSGNCILGIHIPTAFSPNNSGFSENNVYQIIAGLDIAKIDFKIIDRWGNIIFKSEDKKFQWDGSYKGQKCNNGVYAYFVDVSYSTGKSESLSGYITLIR